MGIPLYLAMTAAEFSAGLPLPEKLAWMACHFSPYSTGLSNLPTKLPAGSLLILNDRTPIHGHDPQRIAAQLSSAAEKLKCSAVLLDFQIPGSEEAKRLADSLAEHLSLPLGVSQAYCPESAAVFLPPIPVDCSPESYLAPWQGKEIWLEAALEGSRFRVTASGTTITPLSDRSQRQPIHRDDDLFCHYTIQEDAQSILLEAFRTEDDFRQLLEAAQSFGVTRAIGLYQEFRE